MVKKDKESSKKENTLFVGIDLGTSKTAFVSSNGFEDMIPSIVGWPKDMVAKKFLSKDILIGEEVYKNRLSLTLSNPMKNGIINNTDRDREAAKKLLNHTLNLAKKGLDHDKIFVIVGAPAQTNHINKTSLLEISNNIANSIMVVSEPFVVAYGINKMNHSLIIDMGAGTLDLCRMHATLPEDGDEVSITKAGDFIDQQILDLISRNYKGASLTIQMVQKWKEKYGYVGKPDKKIEVEVPLDGKDTLIDITEEIREGCESIMDDLVKAVKELISSYDPEFQPIIKKNIILAGRLSQIKGLIPYLKKRLEEIGDVEIEIVDDKIFSGARGALELSKDMPPDYWDQVKMD